MTRVLYFAFGSNMFFEQMKKRCPSSEFVCTAVLDDHRLCFPIKSKRRQNAGVASMCSCADAFVEGIVYSMTEKDLKILDRYEAVNIKYSREEISVKSFESGESIRVWTYFAITEDPGASFNPSSEYLGVIVRGAEEHGLSQDYIISLKGIQTS